MKVFISWSGTTSHRVALVLRDWLPSVIQSIRPYVSSEDIDKGARWSSDIAGELDSSAYGIICLTSDNLVAPWINFEAGALGKSIEKSRVSPLLFRLKKSELQGPLLQFQATVIDKPDILKLLQSLNNSCEDEKLELARLEKTFEIWWPILEAELAKIPETASPVVATPDHHLSTAISGVLEELIDLTRANHKILRDPTLLLPPDYIDHITRSPSDRSHGTKAAIQDAYISYREFRSGLELINDLVDHETYLRLTNQLDRVGAPLEYLMDKDKNIFRSKSSARDKPFTKVSLE